MENQNKRVPHKYGANRKEAAKRRKKRDRNFSQSRDIREDRGERQIKTGKPATLPHIGPVSSKLS